MKHLKEKLMKIVSKHDFILVDYQVFPALGVIQFEIVGKDYFPFQLFSDLTSSLGCLSTLSPSLSDGKNAFTLILRLE